MERVFDARLLLLHLDLGRSADVDLRHATRELREALLELLAVVVGAGPVDLGLELADPTLDLLLVALATDQDGLVLGDHDLVAGPEVSQLEGLGLDPEVLEHGLGAAEHGQVLHHGLAAIAEARRLDGAAVERPAETVHDEGREGLALDGLGDDQQRALRLHDLLEDGDQVANRGDLLLVNQDVGVLQLALHRVVADREVGA